MEYWFHTKKRAFLLDFQMPDSFDQMPIGQPRNLRSIDPEDIVRRLQEGGVEAVYVHAKDNQGNCYYDTRYGLKHTGIGDRDLMREFSEACRQVGMTILYYVQQSRERRGNEVESYAARWSDGRPVINVHEDPMMPSRDEGPVICHSGPAREYIKNIVRELAEDYDFDGYWLDGFGWWGRVGICYCDSCRAKYREDTGKNLPTRIDRSRGDWRRFNRWFQTQNRLAEHEIIRTIKDVNPDLTVTHNGAGFQPWADAHICDRDDYVTREFHYNEGYGGGLALWCRQNSSYRPDWPYEIECWRFFNLQRSYDGGYMPRGYAVKPVPLLFAEMATITANGGFVQYYDQLRPDGGLDQLSLDRMKAAFDQVRAREPFLPTVANGQKRARFASVLWSKRTEDFARADQGPAHKSGVEGAHDSLLLERRVLHDLITERRVGERDYRGARVIVAPSAVCMDEEVAAGLREFVKAGGGLVATCRTSLADGEGSPRENFLLADLFGCDYLEPMSFTYSFMKYDETGPLTEGIEPGWPMPLWNKLQLKVAVREGAAGHGNIVNPVRGMMMGHPPQETTPYPAAVTNTYGKGRVVYFPAPLGHAYYDYGHPDLRQLLENAVRWAAGEGPAVEVGCPETVEVVLWEAPEGARYLHLVNRTPGGPARTKASVINEEIPVFDLEVTTRFAVKEAVLQPEGKALKVRAAKGGAVFTVPRVDIHSIVELKSLF